MGLLCRFEHKEGLLPPHSMAVCSETIPKVIVKRLGWMFVLSMGWLLMSTPNATEPLGMMLRGTLDMQK